jgi:hypothetical protein
MWWFRMNENSYLAAKLSCRCSLANIGTENRSFGRKQVYAFDAVANRTFRLVMAAFTVYSTRYFEISWSCGSASTMESDWFKEAFIRAVYTNTSAEPWLERGALADIWAIHISELVEQYYKKGELSLESVLRYSFGEWLTVWYCLQTFRSRKAN